MESSIPILFKSEFAKITAVLGRQLGIEHLETAEDIASETFLAAMETWPYQGMPENPTAWLYTVAKNKALNFIKRHQNFRRNISPAISAGTKPDNDPDFDMSAQNISDSQLQMLFALCHPAIPVEAQIGLSLRILCGFGIDEIATAFLSNRETINKRLFRAKEKLRVEQVQIVFPNEQEVAKRLDTVLRTLYLFFNEGYYSESQDEILREDFCLEAMRLSYLLTENTQTNLPEVNALLALMCFHASRFNARKGEQGFVLYHDQDERKWNHELIARGVERLHHSATGDRLTRYHLEATIAWWHTVKKDTEEKWGNILQLYNHLLVIEYSPMAALNRTYALSKVKGKQVAIHEAEKLKLNGSPYYHTLLGELYAEIDAANSRHHFEMALNVARSSTDKEMIQRKLGVY